MIFQHCTFSNEKGQVIHAKIHQPENEEVLQPQFFGVGALNLDENRQLQFEFPIIADCVSEAFEKLDAALAETAPRVKAEHDEKERVVMLESAIPSQQPIYDASRRM